VVAIIRHGTADGVLDADYFLAVARSLITGTNDYGSLGQDASILNTLTAISNLQPAAEIAMFGTNRIVDFSQFRSARPLRHLPASATILSRHDVVWLIDFRFTGSTTTILSGIVRRRGHASLLKNSGQFNNWKKIDDVVQMFVGLPDSLTCPTQRSHGRGQHSVAGQPARHGIPAQSPVSDHGRQLGVQNIQNGYFFSPLTRQQIKLPRSFTVQASDLCRTRGRWENVFSTESSGMKTAFQV